MSSVTLLILNIAALNFVFNYDWKDVENIDSICLFLTILFSALYPFVISNDIKTIRNVSEKSDLRKKSTLNLDSSDFYLKIALCFIFAFALLDLEYEFYKIIKTFSFAILSYLCYRNSKSKKIWFFIWLSLAITMNPIYSMKASKEYWTMIDSLFIITTIVSFWKIEKKKDNYNPWLKWLFFTICMIVTVILSVYMCKL